MSSTLIPVMFVHILWTATLYALLTWFRAPKVWGIGARPDGDNPFEKFEPRVSANLSNQFEWPLFFYAVCILLIAEPALYKDWHLWLAWTFIAGRFAHSAVQILTNNLRLRGIIFSINFLAVIAMWAILLTH